MRAHTLLTLLLVPLCLSAARPLQAAQKVTLEWKWKKGETYRYRTVTETETTQTDSESPEPETESEQSVEAWRLEIRDISRRGVATIDWIYEVAEGGDFLVEQPLELGVNVQGEVVREPDLSGIMEGIFDEIYEQVLDARPEDMDREELEKSLEMLLEMLEEITGEEAPDVDTDSMDRRALVAEVSKRCEEVISKIIPASAIEEAMSRSTLSFFDVLPGRRVAVGDRWTKSSEFWVPIFGHRARQEVAYTLRKVAAIDGERRARVTVESRVDSRSGEGPSLLERLTDVETIATFEATIAGHYDFSIERGCLVEAVLATDFEFTMEGDESVDNLTIEVLASQRYRTLLVGSP